MTSPSTPHSTDTEHIKHHLKSARELPRKMKRKLSGPNPSRPAQMTNSSNSKQIGCMREENMGSYLKLSRPPPQIGFLFKMLPVWAHYAANSAGTRATCGGPWAWGSFPFGIDTSGVICVFHSAVEQHNWRHCDPAVNLMQEIQQSPSKIFLLAFQWLQRLFHTGKKKKGRRGRMTPCKIQFLPRSRAPISLQM